MKKDKQPYREALEQTISDEQFNTEAIKQLAETLADDTLRAQDQAASVESILLDTLAEPADAAETVDDESIRLTDRTFSHEEDALNKSDIQGRYQIRKTLGTGASGQVFLVLDRVFDREIAVKFLHPKLATNEKKMLQFLNEARITASLAHQNILPIHDIDFTEGALIYFTMAKADGRALSDIIHDAESGTVPQSIAHFNDRVRIIQQVCNAISYAHSKDIIHKDIKPSNIMVGPFGEVLVVDWGTASYDLKDEKKSALIGTPAYMSPEQARREKADKLSDIYCIGATFFHLLTLRFPCWHHDLDTFWKMKRNGELVEPDYEVLKQVPSQLYNIAMKAMAPQQQDRYQDVDDMIADLDAYQHGRSISAYQENFFEFFARLYRHNKLAFILSIICLCTVFTATVWLYSEKYQEYGAWETVHATKWGNMQLADLNSNWELGTPASLNSNTAVNIPDSNDPTEPVTLMQGLLYLRPSQAESTPTRNLRYKHLIPGHLRLSWTHSLLYPQHAIKVFVNGTSSATSYYFVIQPKESSTQLTLYKYGQLLDTCQLTAKISANNMHPFILEASHTTVSLSINGRRVYHYQDPEMLVGSRHQQFGFVIDNNSACSISELRVERQRSPSKRDPIDIAHDFYSNQLYQDALHQYKDIRNNYPDSGMSAPSLYMKARCLTHLQSYNEAAKAYRQFIDFYPAHPYQQYAAAYYIIALAQTRNWAACQSALTEYYSAIALAGLHQHIKENLIQLTGTSDPQHTAIQQDLINTMDTLFKNRP